MDNQDFIDWCELVGSEVATNAMEEICDAGWNKEDTQTVHISDVHQINATNHVISGDIEIGEMTFAFIVESGDNNGSVVYQWCDPEDAETYIPDLPVIYTFVPLDDDLKSKNPNMYRAYLKWRGEPWFKEKERNYNYDRHFAPGVKTERYYRDWASGKGLKPRIVGNE